MSTKEASKTEKEVRCPRCGKLLGYTDTDYQFNVPIQSASYENGKVTFSLKCNRCKEIAIIKFK
jgi:phage FluMu protein Com